MRGLSRRRVIQLTASGSLLLGHRAMAAERIDETGFQNIGGIDQWIAIQGQDRRNPVILFLHGGPGEAQSPFLKEFLPWEKDFTVVNWDQRGSGKTYGRNGASTPDATLNRLIDDACEVADHVRTRLSQKKVILVTQSNGSFLGVHVIKKRPELFHAYAGTGQMVSYQASVVAEVKWARQQAQAAGDQAGLKALDDAAALPFPQSVMAQGRVARQWLWPASDIPYTQMVNEFRASKATSKDAADWDAGADFSGQKYPRFILPNDLHSLGLDMPTPFFVIQGREDHIVGVEPAKAYVEEIKAPTKAFVLIDGGHFACFTNPGGFVGALRTHVRPLAT